jgi:peptidoglycan/LPS O-acetylase OafA/YrhL
MRTQATANLAGPIEAPRFTADIVLECARGIAALWVFMFHIEPMFAPWPLLATLARYGHQGVPLFFVISGYCMYAAAQNTLGAHRAPASFLKRRLWRIFPPFWLSVVVVIIAPYLLEGVSALKSGAFAAPTPTWTAFTWLDWVGLLTLTKVFDNPGGDLQAGFSPVNAVYWSLAIEVQFYLVMYASLFFKSSWQRILAWVTALSVLATFSPALNASGLFMKYWPAFILGALLRVAHRRGWTPAALFGRHEIALSLGAALLLGAAVLGVIYSPACSTPLACSSVPNLTFTLASAVAALALWLFAGVEHGVTKAPWRAKARLAWLLLPFAWLGQSSYSLYLLHGKIYQLPEMVVRQLIAPSSLAYPLLTIAGTAALCYGFYLLAEKPFHAYAKRVDAGQAPGAPLAAGART